MTTIYDPKLQQLEADVVHTRSEYDHFTLTKVLAGVLLPIPIILAGFWLLSNGWRGVGLTLIWAGFAGPPVIGMILTLIGKLRPQPKPETVDAMATLMALAPTGIRINKEPVMELRLRVEAPDHPTFMAVHKQRIPGSHLHEIVPGTLLPVIFERDDRRQLILAPQGTSQPQL